MNFKGTLVCANERLFAVQLSQVQGSLQSKVCLIDSQSGKVIETFDFKDELLLQTGNKRWCFVHLVADLCVVGEECNSETDLNTTK